MTRTQQASEKFTHQFTRLNMDEAARINRLALQRGWMLTPFADRQDELLAHVDTPPLQVEDLTRDMFPHLDDKTYETTVRIYQDMSDKGFRPGIFRSEQEQTADALLSYLISTKENWPADLTTDYPLVPVK